MVFSKKNPDFEGGSWMKIWKPLKFFISRKMVGGRGVKSIWTISRFHWVFYFEGFPNKVTYRRSLLEPKYILDSDQLPDDCTPDIDCWPCLASKKWRQL